MTRTIFPYKVYALYCLLNMGSVFSQTLYKTMEKLPDTGQSSSFTGTFGEDADFIINPPAFLVQGNGMVTDSITGLIWQEADGGEMTFENAVDYCANLNLGNYTDWRLPDTHELFSIQHHEYVNPSMDTSAFANSLAEYWWSSDKDINDTTKIWVSNSGGGIGNHPRTETLSAGGSKRFHVRAVRSPTTLPQVFSSQFMNNANSTVTDQLTSLTWQQVIYTDSLTWEESLNYADTLSLAGFTDWRLPNAKELQSLTSTHHFFPAVEGGYFTGLTPDANYWTSTSLINQATNAWISNMQYGIITYASKQNKNKLICVRGNSGVTAISILKKPEQKASIIIPNPVSRGHSPSFFIPVNFKGTLAIYNSQGDVIYATGLTSCSNEKKESGWVTDKLPSGIYFYKLTDNEAGYYMCGKILLN